MLIQSGLYVTELLRINIYFNELFLLNLQAVRKCELILKVFYISHYSRASTRVKRTSFYDRALTKLFKQSYMVADGETGFNIESVYIVV